MGPRQRGHAARGARAGDRRLVSRDARDVPVRAAAPEGQLQRLRGRPGRDPATRPRRQPAVLRLRGGRRGSRRLHREASARLLAVPAPPVRIWLMAARPRTLPAAVAPVLVGTSLAIRYGTFHPIAFIAALLGAMLIQIGTNLSNDYSDARRGADSDERIGPVRVTAGGLVP